MKAEKFDADAFVRDYMAELPKAHTEVQQMRQATPPAGFTAPIAEHSEMQAFAAMEAPIGGICDIWRDTNDKFNYYMKWLVWISPKTAVQLKAFWAAWVVPYATKVCPE